MSKIKSINQGKGMVDVGQKQITERTAVASATVQFSQSAYQVLTQEGSPKGDVFATAKVAAVMAAKSTPSLIPLCHPLELSKVQIDFEPNDKKYEVVVIAEVSYQGRTGVEMEALAAVSIAALTIYDMMKWADKSMVISDVKLLKKSGGKSGDFNRG